MSIEGYKKHVQASEAPPPLTADEQELKMIKESEVSYLIVMRPHFFRPAL